MPPPKLISAVFCEDGLAIFAKMSAATDRAASVLPVVTNFFPCSRVLSFPGASIDRCLWIDALTIKIILSAKVVPTEVGDVLSLNVNTVKALCERSVQEFECNKYIFSEPSSVLIEAPSKPIVPSPVIFAPSVINRCGDITLDISSTSGRGSSRWKSLIWTVASSNGSHITSLETFLRNITSSNTDILNIPNLLFDPGTYKFTLCVTNMFFRTSCAAKVVSVSQSSSVPTVSISGPHFTARYLPFTALGSALFPGCDGMPSSIEMRYVYELYKISGQNYSMRSATGIVSNSQNPRIFKVKAFILDPGTYYVLVLRAYTSHGASSSTELVFFVNRGLVKAIIAQGFEATIFQRSYLSLDARLSYQLDYPADKSMLTIRWECIQFSPNFGQPCHAHFSNEWVVVFDAKHFNASCEYRMTLIVQSIFDENVTDAASIVIRIRAGLSAPALHFKDLFAKYNPNTRILISGIVETGQLSCDATWSAFDGSGSPYDLYPVTLTPLLKTLSYGVTNFGLTIKKDSFPAGSTFTLRLSATYFSSESTFQAKAHSDVVIVINESPSGGIFTVTPPKGTSLVTLFFFRSSGWSDDISDYPLVYRFMTYSIDSMDSKLIRDYFSVSHVTAFVAEGFLPNDYSITCVSWIADNLGFEIPSEEDIIQVFPQENSSVLLQSGFSLLNSTKVNIDLKHQVLNAVASNFNHVDCTGAPFCESLNREACLRTIGTCGPCRKDFLIGQHGDANSACLSTPLFTENNMLTHFSIVNDIAKSSKQCPMSCSLNGLCVSFDWMGNKIADCKIIDSSCRVACVCDRNFYGFDCSKSQVEHELDRTGKEFICKLGYELKNSIDISVAVLVDRANLLSRTFRDMTTITNAAYISCSLMLLESILESPSVAASDMAILAVITALSDVLELGPKIPELIHTLLIESIKSINEYRQLTMFPGEIAVSIYSRNLRYLTSVIYLGDLVNTKVWHVARSSLEIAVNSNTTMYSIVHTMALNETVHNTINNVGISSWEILKQTTYNAVNSSRLQLQTQIFDDESASIPEESLTIVLYNHEVVNYDKEEKFSGAINCFPRGSLLPYDINVKCGDHFETVICPGNISVFKRYNCSYAFDGPKCLIWDGAQFAVNTKCFVSHYDVYSTTCTCNGSAERRKLHEVSPNYRLYDYMSSKVVSTVELQIETYLITDVPDYNRNFVLIFITALAFIVTVLIGMFQFVPKSQWRYAVSAVESNPDFVNSILCAVELLHLRYESGSSRISILLDIFLHKSEYWGFMPNGIILSSIEMFRRWSITVGAILNVMYVHAVLAWLVYPDNGHCQQLLTEASCESNLSILQVYTHCEWRYDGHPYCMLRSPLSDIKAVFILLAMVAIISVALNDFWLIAVEVIIARYSFYHKSSVAVCADDSYDVREGVEHSAPIASCSEHDLKPNLMIVNEGSKEGTVEEEANYVLEEANKIISATELELSVSLSPGLQLKLLLDALDLDKNGKPREYSTFRNSRPADRIHKMLSRARQRSTHIIKAHSFFTNVALGDCYLIEQFLLNSLIAPLRFFALKHFFKLTSFMPEYRTDSTCRRYCGNFLPIHILISVSMILYLGFQWYGKVTNITWAYLVAASVLLEVLILSSLRLIFKVAIIPTVFLFELRKMHKKFKSKFGAIIKKMEEETTSPGFQLIQHLNPCCRTARQIDAATALTDSLMWISDADSAYICDTNETATGFWNTIYLGFLTFLKYKLQILYSLIPEIATDFVLNVFVTICAVAFAFGMLFLAGVSLYLPYFVFIIVAVFFILLNYNTSTIISCEKSSKAVEKAIRNILRSSYDSAYHVKLEDCLTIRDALISSESNQSELDEPASTGDWHRVASTKLELDYNNSKVVPADTDVDYNGTSELNSRPTSRNNLSLRVGSKNVDKYNPRLIPVDDSIVIVNSLSSHVETPRSRANLLEPISLVKTAESGLDQTSTASKVGRVHISGRDYLILTTAIAQFLSMQEACDDEFNGVPESAIVEWVVKQSLAGRELADAGPKIALLVKRETKILRKVIKRMAEKDKSIVVVISPKQGELTKLYKLSPFDDIRKKLFLKTSSTMHTTKRDLLHHLPASLKSTQEDAHHV